MKRLETRSVVIGDNSFYIRPLPAFKAANISGELATLVLPILTGLAPMLGGVGADKGLLDIDIEDAAPTISNAFTSLSGDKLEEILKLLLIAGQNISVQTADSDKAVILTEDLANEIFCTEVQDMFKLAFEVIRINYNGFFSKLAAQFGPLTEAIKTPAAR